MKLSMPQYVVTDTVLGHETVASLQSPSSARKANNIDIAASCCDVTLALSAGDFQPVDLDACFTALETKEVHHYGQFSACTSLFDAASEMMRKSLADQQDSRMATMALSVFFSPFAPTIFSIAPHLLFGDTGNCRDNEGNRYRTRIRVARKGPMQSCALLEWSHSKKRGGLMIGGQRFLESLLQIAELSKGMAEPAQKAHVSLFANTA